MGRYEAICHTGTSTGWEWNCYYFLAGTGMVIISILAPLFSQFEPWVQLFQETEDCLLKTLEAKVCDWNGKYYHSFTLHWLDQK